MENRAQAAMEFIMTYGWAILAAVIAIGVLAYFNVFTPSKYLSGTAVVSSPFYIEASNVKTNGVTLGIKNNGGQDYEIQSVAITNCGTNSTVMNITADSTLIYFVGCTLTSGSTLKGDITITYRKQGVAVDLTSTGTIAERVAAA